MGLLRRHPALVPGLLFSAALLVAPAIAARGTLNAAASAAPTGRVTQGDQPALARSTVVYAPMPTNAE